MDDKLSVDWFQATIEADTLAVLGILSILAGQMPSQMKGRHGYRRGMRFECEAFEAEVLDLGGDGYPHVKASGSSAPFVRRALRDLGLPGRVSRIDIASDSDEGWDSAAERVQAWAQDHPKTVVTHVGDFTRAERGRTLYIGAPTSGRRIRVYEKGVQLGQNPNWVRVELQIRPDNRGAKYWAFGATLQELANSSKAFVSVRASEGAYAPPLYERPERRPIHALMHQYGRILASEVPEAHRAILEYLK